MSFARQFSPRRGIMTWNLFRKADIVGAWRVDAEGAPFVPHLFTFTDDGHVFTTNPTNVQEESQNLNDSLGMGAWRRGRRGIYEGTFVQLNAFADSHTPGPELRVTFKIDVRGRDEHRVFSGPAVVHFGDERVPDAVLIGSIINISESDLALLNDA